MNYTIDATNKSLGRLATEVASILMGKNSPTFARNTVSDNTVTVTNASKIKASQKKLLEKTYKSFSGYPGGLKIETMAKVTATKGYREVVATAVKGMLPDNKLKKDMMKHLTVTE
jgi:large subunit ribosomal protein L13